MTTRRRLALACRASLIAALACTPSAPPSPHQVLGPDTEPLRTAFNANVGKVRIIMLVAPT